MSRHHGFLKHLGITSASVEDGVATMSLDVKAEHLSPVGTVHGGVVFALADTSMGLAIWSALGPGETTATISASIDYLAPVREGSIVAEARVVSRGRRIAFTHAVVRDAAGTPVAQCTASFHLGKASERRAGKEEGEPVAGPEEG